MTAACASVDKVFVHKDQSRGFFVKGKRALVRHALQEDGDRHGRAGANLCSTLDRDHSSCRVAPWHHRARSELRQKWLRKRLAAQLDPRRTLNIQWKHDEWVQWTAEKLQVISTNWSNFINCDRFADMYPTKQTTSLCIDQNYPGAIA